MNFSTADLFDDFADQLQSCELSFQNFGGIKSFFGQISTIRCYEDNGLIPPDSIGKRSREGSGD